MKFFWLSFFFALKIHAATVEELSVHPTWQRLLHWDGSQSRVDSDFFFIAPNGKSDLLEELKATINAFKNKVTLKDEPWPLACSFVARYNFLKSQGIELPTYDCQEYKWWRKSLAIKSVSIVFSSYYVGNPASIFGHTFLKLNFDPNHQSKLTDYAVTFAANATDSIGFVYAFKGLFGGYQGFYAIDPYYLKINEYVHTESRDLWEYPINLNEAEIDRMLAHLWELTKKGWFSYWFADENCSYQLLSLLDVAYGDSTLAANTSLIVLPAETLKILSDSQKLGDGSIRPSYRKQVNYRYSLISGSTENESDPLVLDALISKKRFDQLKHNDEPDMREKIGLELKELLKKRIAIKYKSPSAPASWTDEMHDEDPILAHDPRQFSLAQGFLDDEHFSQIGFRLGLHGMTDRLLGLPWHSELIYGGINLRHSKEEIKVQSIEGIKIFSPTKSSAVGHPWSWRVDLEATRILGLPDSLTPRLSGQIGKTYEPISKLSVHVLIGAEANTNQSLKKSYALGPNFDLGALYGGQHLRILLNLLAFQPLNESKPVINAKLKVQAQLNNDWEIAISGIRNLNTPYQELKNSDELLAMLMRHF